MPTLMTSAFLSNLADRIEALKADGLFKRGAGHCLAAAGRGQASVRCGLHQSVRQQLPGAVQSPVAHRCGPGRVEPVRVRDVVGAVHLRHSASSQAPGRTSEQIPEDGGHHPVSQLLRRERGSVRGHSRPRGRGHLRCAEPCLHHRRGTPLQGEAVALRQWRHEGPGGEARRGRRRTLSPDRHRRRVLDGRLHRRPAGHLRPGGEARRDGDGR